MKNKKELVVIIGFIATLVAPLALGIAIHNKQGEKKLAEFPTELTDDYLDNINDWYNDHTPFRTGMIDIYNGFFTDIETNFRNWMIQQDIKNHQGSNSSNPISNISSDSISNYVSSTSIHEHSYVTDRIVKEATDEEEGLEIQKCSCGDEIEVVIPKVPHTHTFSTEWSADNSEHWHAATCKHDTLRIDVESHEYDEVLYNKDHNPYFVCKICGYVGTLEDTHTHNYVQESIVIAPTEEEEGLQVQKCTICGKEIEAPIAKLNHAHTFSQDWTSDNKQHWHAATCKHDTLREGVEDHVYTDVYYDANNTAYFTCSVCGYLGAVEEESGHVHIVSKDWKYDDTNHWHEGLCQHNDILFNLGAHKFGSWHIYDESKGLRAKTCATCGYEYIEDISSKLETTIDATDYGYYPYVKANNSVLYGRDDWLYYLGDDSMNYYKGTNVMSDTDRDNALAKMQALQDACDAKGILLIYGFFPNKDHVYPEYMPTVEGMTYQLKREQQFNNYIQYYTDFNFIYPLTLLKNGKSTYDTYYKQDSHWNEYGGFLTAQETFKRLGWTFRDYSIYTVNKNGGDLTILSSATPVNYIEPKIDYAPDITLELTHRETYRDEQTSSNKNGKNLLVIGDSYRYNYSTYFSKEVEFTVSAHRNQLGNSAVVNFAKGLKAGDIVIYCCAERLDFDAFNNIDKLTNLIKIN